MASITLTIQDSKLAEFKLGFFKRQPVPTDSEGVPTMTENAWLREWGKQAYLREYRNGKTMIASEASQPAIDPIIVT